jgi:hypothetical protein
VHWEQTGQLLSVDGVGLRISRGDGDPLQLAWEDVESLRVERSTRGAYWEGGLIGLAVGLLVAEGIVAAERDNGRIDPSCGQYHCYSTGFWVAVGAAGAGVGAGVGGLLFKRTLWEDVPLPGQESVRAETGFAWTANGAEFRLHLVH